MYDESVLNLLKIDDEPESPNEGACVRLQMDVEPESPNEETCVRL